MNLVAYALAKANLVKHCFCTLSHAFAVFKILIFRNVDLGLYCAFNRNKRKHDPQKMEGAEGSGGACPPQQEQPNKI